MTGYTIRFRDVVITVRGSEVSVEDAFPRPISEDTQKRLEALEAQMRREIEAGILPEPRNIRVPYTQL